MRRGNNRRRSIPPQHIQEKVQLIDISPRSLISNTDSGVWSYLADGVARYIKKDSVSPVPRVFDVMIRG